MISSCYNEIAIFIHCLVHEHDFVAQIFLPLLPNLLLSNVLLATILIKRMNIDSSSLIKVIEDNGVIFIYLTYVALF